MKVIECLAPHLAPGTRDSVERYSDTAIRLCSLYTLMLIMRILGANHDIDLEAYIHIRRI